jgi:hypothetical protein
MSANGSPPDIKKALSYTLAPELFPSPALSIVNRLKYPETLDKIL